MLPDNATLAVCQFSFTTLSLAWNLPFSKGLGRILLFSIDVGQAELLFSRAEPELDFILPIILHGLKLSGPVSTQLYENHWPASILQKMRTFLKRPYFTIKI